METQRLGRIPLCMRVAKAISINPNPLSKVESKEVRMTDPAMENDLQGEQHPQVEVGATGGKPVVNLGKRAKKAPPKQATGASMASTPKRLYTLKEAARYLGRSDWGMRTLVWAGSIPVVREEGGRKIFIDVGDLSAYVERNKEVYH